MEWLAHDLAEKNLEERERCAILARTPKMLEKMGQKLFLANIPAYFPRRNRDFLSAPFRMLLAILRLANRQSDKKALAQLNKAFFELEGADVSPSEITFRASAGGLDWLRAWLAAVKDLTDLAPETRRLLESDINPLINSLSYDGFSKALLEWARKRQNSGAQAEAAFNEFAAETKAWNRVLSEIGRKYAGEAVTLRQFLRELDLAPQTPPREKGAVSCFTLQASKGLEFEHVYLMCLVEDELPSWAAVRKGEGSREMQEERRDCFAAMTRAQTKLTLTFSAEVFGWRKDPSRFLTEMGLDVNG